ncbi:Nicotinate phosphoribosyltransferase-like protein [Artemisia annua]|uniref:Nicotinate phosphoribosyltransferase-like protein n=1 Tax=Artemisia annua TaxID=35608 RepID=A0A2U1MGZ5_ARTAN|nr:Nicotinate phosphoribosyltransferase-like protein [Artemisia annua]
METTHVKSKEESESGQKFKLLKAWLEMIQRKELKCLLQGTRELLQFAGSVSWFNVLAQWVGSGGLFKGCVQGFDLYFSKKPFGSEYTVFVDLEKCIRFIANLTFSKEDVAFVVAQIKSVWIRL